MSQIPREKYIRRVLELYQRTPGTLGRLQSRDRILAAKLHDSKIPINLVKAALLVTAARRAIRPTSAGSLSPIASLGYFMPVIEELTCSLPSDDYLEYLEQRLLCLFQLPDPKNNHRIL